MACTAGSKEKVDRSRIVRTATYMLPSSNCAPKHCEVRTKVYLTYTVLNSSSSQYWRTAIVP